MQRHGLTNNPTETMSDILLHRRRMMTASGINPMCIILYTTTDDTLLTGATYYNTNPVKSNTYKDGQGKLVFENIVDELTANAFSGSNRLKSIILPDGVTSIGTSALRVAALISANIPDSVVSIGDYAFYGCSFNAIILPDGLLTIGNLSFAGCNNLSSVTIPNSVTSIGDRAFNVTNEIVFEGKHFIEDGIQIAYYASRATSIIFPQDITKIGDSTFYRSSVNSLTIPNSVTSLGVRAISECKSLTTLIIPGSVTSIGERAVQSCTGLTHLEILPTTVTIGNYAFRGCSHLSSVVWNVKNCPDFGSYGAAPFGGSVLASIVFGNEVEHIPAYMCYDLPLTSVTIPNSVTSIGAYAFYSCDNLLSVTIGNGVTSIGNGAFRLCTGLTSITIPSSVTSSGTNVFAGCTGLQSVVIESKYLIETNGIRISNLFPDCGGAFTISNDVTRIGNSVFQNCTGMTSITIPNGVTTISDSVFRECSGLISVTIPNTVTSIVTSAFRGCSSLTSVTLPNGLTSIGANAFQRCSSLTSVVIPDGITSILIATFDQCSGLQYIDLNNVDSLRQSAFGSCTSLTTVKSNSNTLISTNRTSTNNLGNMLGTQVTEYILGPNVVGIGNYAFYSNSSLASIRILRTTDVLTLGTDAILSTSVTIYVPNALLSQYQADSNWNIYTLVGYDPD